MNITELSEWFDFRTLLLANGDPVDSWGGRRALYTLTASGTEKPMYVMDDGDGNPALQLDGVDDRMTGETAISNAALFGTTGDFEVWIVARLDTTQEIGGGYFHSTGITNQIGFYAESPMLTTLSIPTGSENVQTAIPLWDDSWHVIRLAKTGASRLVQVDGVTMYQVTTTAGTYGTGADVLRLGDYFSYRMTGAYRHWLAMTAPLDDAAAAALTTYLEAAK